tara:strand:- start:33 stop:542 length:510 start_codon:yes stop_codon:yes gene_type:complete
MSRPITLKGRYKKQRNSFIMEESKRKLDNSPYNEYVVRLHFPMAVTIPFEMSISCAFNSDYLKTLIENEDNVEDILGNENLNEQQIQNIVDKNIEKKYLDYVIPFSFYKTMRFLDIKWFIDLWKGIENIYGHETKYNCLQTTQLTRALLMNENLHFVRTLQENFPMKVD